MVGFIFFFLIAVVVVARVLLPQSPEKKQAAADLRARLNAEDEAARITRLRGTEERAAFRSNLDPHWVHSPCRFEDQVGVFALARDFLKIQIVTFPHENTTEDYISREFAMPNITTTQIRVPTVVETTYRKEYIPVAITNKKSPVGRALIGGIIAGPAGVIAGAVSGLGGKSTITSEEKVIAEQHTKRGCPLLLLGVKGEPRPLEVSFMVDSHAEHWLHQIRAAKGHLGLPI